LTPLHGLNSLLHSQLANNWQLKVWTVGSLLVLKNEIQNGHGYIVSNGSYRNDAGVAAWIIEGQSASSWIISTMITPGSSKDQSSFHSKLAGIYGILCTLESLDLGTTQFQCQIACNGKSILDCITSAHPVLPTEPHTNLLQAVKSKASQLGIRINWCHVKGHQDGQMPTVLSRNAWLKY